MIKIVDIHLYKCSVIFLIETTLDEWKTFFDEQYKKGNLISNNDVDVREELEAKTPGFVFSTGLNDYICYINDANCAGLVAHEIFHVANAMLQDKGLIMDANGEAWAYLIEFLTVKFYDIIDGKEESI